MKPETLSDALAALDDELIDEVGRLREQPKKRRLPVRRMAAAAAVLIAAAGVGVFAVSRLPKAPEETPTPTLQTPTKGDEALPATQPTTADDWQTGGLDGGAYAGTREWESVRIERFTQSGFIGVLADGGESVEVKMTADAAVSQTDAAGNPQELPYTEARLSQGMTVNVRVLESGDGTTAWIISDLIVTGDTHSEL